MNGYAIAINPNQPQNFIQIPLSDYSVGAYDLLIDVKASAMNPIDTKLHLNLQKKDLDMPCILGFDGSGVILAMGQEVKGFSLGDAVWYSGDITRSGCNATHQLVDYRVVSHKPTSLNWAESAALPLTTLTAWEALFEKLHLQRASKTKTILIIGGAGGVGSIAISLAALRTRVRVVATASTPESVQWCLDRGAHLTVDYHHLKQNLADLHIQQVDYILCASSTDEYWDVMSELIAPFGHICALVESQKPLAQSLIREKSVTLHWEFMSTKTRFQTPDMVEQGRILSEIAYLVDQGKIKTTLSQILSGLNVENIQSAHLLQKRGRMRGKIVITH